MKLTPIDVKSQHFNVSWKGYNQKEVRDFLEIVSADQEEITHETNELRDDLKRIKGELTEHVEREKMLRETMLTAQRMTKEIEERASKQAEILLTGAELKGEKIIDAAHRRAATIMEQISDLRRQRSSVEAALRATLQSHLKMIDSTAEEKKEMDELDEKLKFLTPKGR